MGIFTFIFCSLFFAINASAVVVVNGVSQESQVGETIAINANLTSGENFVNWKIAYGGGTFGNEKIFNTTFIPSTDSVVIEYVAQKGSYKELTDKATTYPYYENAISIPHNSYYGIATEYTPKEDGTYALLADVQRSIQYINYATDKTFTKQAANLLQRKDANGNNVNTTHSTSVRYFNAQKDSTQYIFLRTTDFTNIPNEIYTLHVEKTYALNTAVEGKGTIEVSEIYRTMNLKGDSINIKAVAETDNKFDHWEVTSGNCLIQDTKQESTHLIFKTTDCEVKAFFTAGKVYTITETPVQYSTGKDFFAKKASTGSTGVRFSFTAPADGNYTFVISNKTPNATITSTSYKSNDFLTSQTSKNFSGTYSETLTLTKGQAIGFTVNSSTDQNFWISYSTQAGSIKISASANGTENPADGYDPAYVGSKYFIGANADEGYRFSDWQIVSGNATIDEENSPFTFITINSDTEIKANYKKNQVQTLTTTKTRFNYQTHYFNETTLSTIRFKLSIPDTNTNVIQIKSIDSQKAILTDYGNDSTFKVPVATHIIAKDSAFYIPKDSVQHIYWTLKDDSDNIPNTSFYAWILKPYILKIKSTNEGSFYPKGDIKMLPYETGLITAWPYGGYTFNHWERVEGSLTISSPEKAQTKITLQDSLCIIKAVYDIDSTVNPELRIINLDLGNLPGICAQVSVTDKKNGNSICGLDKRDFVLKEDGNVLSKQVTTIESVTGISTVLVVDESTSMSIANRMAKAKESIRQFISDMGPYDRTAIVGFRGGDLTIVHQSMTSNKDLLFQATDSLKAIAGTTNINTGAYAGIEQVIGEINPTAVIVFSDGVNTGAQNKSVNEVIDYSKEQKTTIFTIALENTNEIPLKIFADSTGGSFTIASDASELAGIYASIRDQVQSQYLVCYQTPDIIKNGDTHIVDIQVSLSGKEASDTTEWKESTLPPEIRLTEETWNKVENPQQENVEMPLQFYITNSGAIKTASIFLRTTSLKEATFDEYPLTHLHDSLWQYTVPAEKAVFPGLDFYVTATDTNKLLGKSPQIQSPSKEPYTIAILNAAPEITPVTLSCNRDGFKKIAFRIFDNDGISKVLLYYKNAEATLFNEATMVKEPALDSTWFLNVPADAEVSSGLNFYVRAIDSNGVSARWEREGYTTSETCIANTTPEDKPDTITIASNDKESSITRYTESLQLQVITENFTEDTDTISVKLSCKVSGDIETQIRLIEYQNGFFEGVIAKDERTPKKDDGTISCAGTDTLIAEYKDPLFGTFAYDTVLFNNFVPITYQFLELEKDKNLDSIETVNDADFRIRVTAADEKFHRIDTVNVVLFTKAGDSLRIKAIETDTNSAIFDYTGKFTFIQDSSELTIGGLEGLLDLQNPETRVKIQAQVHGDTSALKSRDSLVVLSNYIPADSAEIYDRDLDGKADFIRIHFLAAPKQNKTSIDTLFWNGSNQEWRSIDKEDFTIPKKSSWIEATLKKPFKYGLTEAKLDEKPYLRFLKTSSTFAQKIFINDKVGAVPVMAEKRPGQTLIDEDLNKKASIPPDTLFVTLSEKIVPVQSKKTWKKLFRYSETCKDTASQPILPETEPEVTANGTVWTLILKNSSITTGNCIRLDPTAEYVDAYENSLGRGGVQITGEDGSLHLYDIKPNPTVTGIGNKAEWIPPDEKEFESVPDTISSVQVFCKSSYKASIYIYDATGHFVNHFDQEFGYDGEMDDDIRFDKKSNTIISYLYWDQHAKDGRKVGTGIYIWKIKFKFDDGYSETYTLKTGIRRNPDEK